MSLEATLPDEVKRDLSIAAEILKKEGCKEVYIFGSIARGTSTSSSDLDVATVGLVKERFFSAYGKLLSSLKRRIDLVALDYDTEFGQLIRKSGALTRVA